jgi:IS4 transposase
MKRLFLMSLLMCLTGCFDETPQEKAIREANDKVYCEPELVTTSPDGVNLWKVTYMCSRVRDTVYFSSRGTQSSHAVRSGKTTYTVIDEVPNAE